MLASPAILPEEVTFGDQLKAARSAELRRIKDAISQLSPDELKYMGYVQVDEYTPHMSVIKEAQHYSKPGKITQEMKAEQLIQRRAKRLEEKQSWAKRMVEEAEQKRLAKLAKKAEDAAISARAKEDRRRSLERKKENPVERHKYPSEIGPLKVVIKHFQPIIGKVNAAGETPVKISHNTTIMVRPGKDVEETVAKYQKHLNLKS